jgi:hypothetical protein
MIYGKISSININCSYCPVKRSHIPKKKEEEIKEKRERM